MIQDEPAADRVWTDAELKTRDVGVKVQERGKLISDAANRVPPTAINDDIFNSMANIVGRLLDDPTNPAILAELQGVHDVLVAAVPE